MVEFLNAGSNGENGILYDNQDSCNLNVGRTRALAPYESFLMTVIRLRRNFSINHFAFLFQIAESTISNTFTTGFNFMFVRRGSGSIWPSEEKVWESIPRSMKETIVVVSLIALSLKWRYHPHVYACVMDMTKAFDNVKHSTLFWKHEEKAIPPIFLRLLVIMYSKQQAKCQVEK